MAVAGDFWPIGAIAAENANFHSGLTAGSPVGAE
jgi:hypothetical protein